MMRAANLWSKKHCNGGTSTFARIVTVKLKPGVGPDYARTIDEVVIPIMRKCAGFRDEIAMVSTDGTQMVGISLWERREDAEAYSREAYRPEIEAIQGYMDGEPALVTYDVTNSTAHGIVALAART